MTAGRDLAASDDLEQVGADARPELSAAQVASYASKRLRALGFVPAPSPTGKVQSSGTTANAPSGLGDSEWIADMQHVFGVRMRPVIDGLLDRSKACHKRAKKIGALYAEPGTGPGAGFCDPSVAFGSLTAVQLIVRAMKSARWADDRARALALDREDVVGACGKRQMRVACGCSDITLPVGCDQPQICVDCRKRHSRLWQRRITAGMDVALRRARKAWFANPYRRGMRPGVYMITLTAPHSGDLVVDRERMGKAVRKLLKHATAEGWFSAYALTWEATAGAAGDGHLHCHLACVSSWIPYSSMQADPMALAHARADDDGMAHPRRARKRLRPGLHEVWERVMKGSHVVNVSAPKRGEDGARGAAQYLAKYVTKGVDPVEFTGCKAGELLAAFRGKRKVTTSAHFWPERDATCECCREAWRMVESPQSLRDLMPGAVLTATSVLYRRGVPPPLWYPSALIPRPKIFGRPGSSSA